MDELERRLRESLAARAEDVEPTPALWFAVQERVARRRRRTWMLAGVGTAAAVLLGVIVIPNVLDRRPTEFAVDPTPTDEPSTPGGSPSPSAPSPTSTVAPPVSTPTPIAPPSVTPSETEAAGPGGPPVIPERYATTDGTSIVIHSDDGERTVFTQPTEGESTVTNLAVRPAGDGDGGTTIVFLSQGEGMWFLRYLVYDAASDTVEGPEQFPTQYDISDDARSASTPPVPVWSPDGKHLAWLEEVGDTVRLRTIGWIEGLGTGNTADDNADFGLDYLAGTYPTLEDWTWTAGMELETTGFLFITTPFRQGGSFERVQIDRQGDGALAASQPGGEPDHGGFVVDHADSHANDGGAVGPEYELTIVPSQSQDDSLDLRLAWSSDGDRSGQLPVPPELTQGADPSAFWMTARDDAVFLGRGGQAWLITRDSEIEQLPGTVHDAAFLPN